MDPVIRRIEDRLADGPEEIGHVEWCPAGVDEHSGTCECAAIIAEIREERL